MPLPFDLPGVTAGFAALTAGARKTGTEVAAATGQALSTVLGGDLSIQGRAVPGGGAPRAGAARVTIDLPALPACAVLEVESALVVGLVDALAGGPGSTAGAASLTPVEASFLELLTLCALDGACSIEPIEATLAPRLSRAAAEPPASALGVELEVAFRGVSGRARLLLPAAALRALAGAPGGELEGPAAGLAVPVSARSGRAVLSAEELSALEPGDVLLLDAPGDPPDALALPGGVRVTGRIEDGSFHVEEVTMADRHATLPVTLEVELARVEIPLSELARLEPGATLPLALDRRGLVTLRVGERAVARGELVDVDGAVGVRVTSVEAIP